MTNITIIKKNGIILGVTVKGHSGYADKGEDIVCSAISSIVQTAMMGLIKVLKIDLDYEKNEREGYIKFNLPENISTNKINKASIILETMKEGLNDISLSYPNNIKMEVKNEFY